MFLCILANVHGSFILPQFSQVADSAFQRLGKDQAFRSGPSVIQDLLSIVIYIAISVSIVG